VSSIPDAYIHFINISNVLGCLFVCSLEEQVLKDESPKVTPKASPKVTPKEPQGK